MTATALGNEYTGNLDKLAEVMEINAVVSNWVQGTYTNKLGKYTVQIKCFAEGSSFGINGGRISKLWVREHGKRKASMSYERDWDIYPATRPLKRMLEKLLEALS